MSVTAVIQITQFEINDSSVSVRSRADTASRSGYIRNSLPAATGDLTYTHIPAVSNPVPGVSPPGSASVSDSRWSDSPTRQPLLLYRHRFGWGRDKAELFPQPGIPSLSVGDTGARWGELTNYSGPLLYEREFPLSAEGSSREFTVEDSGYVRDSESSLSSAFLRLYETGEVSGDVNVLQYPFLLLAVPEPFSEKNSVDTDVFIRLSNYAFPLASGTITLYLDDAVQTGLQIEEFFSGLGGFNVTWNNDFLFEYDARVAVRWEFSDTDVPANRFVIRYPFDTVQDLASPRIYNLVPDDEAIGVPVGGPIYFTIEDFENDVDIDSLILYVNNIKIVGGENGTIITTRLGNEKGYIVQFTPGEPWLYGDLIPVAIFVSDTSKNANETFFTYSFTTLESTAPRLINVVPAPCTIGVPVGTDISVDVIGGGHGLDKDTIVLTVEEIEMGSVIQLIPVVHRDD